MKWLVFSYNFGWSKYILLFDGWLAKCSMAMPIVGYLILFNDSISHHISFNTLASESMIGFGLTPIARLKFVYFGLIFLGLANILYRVRRPFILKIGKDEFEYVERALRHFTVSAYIDIHGTIRYEGNHTLHGKYYDAEYDAFLNLALGEQGSARQRNEATADWNGAKSKYEGLLRSMLIENFARNVVTRRHSLTACLIFSFVGYFLLLIPSADLFAKVLAATLRS
jgi:hypothetical protein